MKKTIWQDDDLLDPVVEEQYRLNLGEGHTALEPIPDIAQQLGLNGTLWLKREDQNPTGSHKDRGTAWRLSKAWQTGTKKVVIPSSGNAAISVSAYAQQCGMEVLALVSPHIAPAKLSQLQSYPGTRIILTERGIDLAPEIASHYGYLNMRPSIDPLATVGFRTLAREITRQATARPLHIFIFSTSGTALEGLGEGMNRLLQNQEIDTLPTLHVVQSIGKSGIVDALPATNQCKLTSGEHIADNLGVANSPRAKTAARWVRESGGSGWEADARTIEVGRALLETHYKVAWESCAVLGVIKRAVENEKLNGNVVAISTGVERNNVMPDNSVIPMAETMEQVRSILG